MIDFFHGFEKKAGVGHLSGFEGLKSLNLADHEYCVMGGAVELLGIRKSNDLDVLVLPQVLDRVAKEHNLKKERSFLGSTRIELGNIELFDDDGFGRSAQDWIRNSRTINGIRVGSTSDLITWKKKLMQKPGRNPQKVPQDKKDIESLERLR